MTTTCAWFCGGNDFEASGAIRGADGNWYCSAACCLAGRALHPVSKPPGEPVPDLRVGDTVSWCRNEYVLTHRDEDGDWHGAATGVGGETFRGTLGMFKPYMVADAEFAFVRRAAPGSALPLPGPPACYHRELRPGCDGCFELLRKHADSGWNLANKRTRQWQSADRRVVALEARLAVTVGALELLVSAADAMPYAQHYGHFDREGGAGRTCPARIDERKQREVIRERVAMARAALAPTGAPPAKKEE